MSMIREITCDEIDLVSGATETDVNIAAAMIGGAAAVGFLVAGPVGAAAGAVSGAIHAGIIIVYLHEN